MGCTSKPLARDSPLVELSRTLDEPDETVGVGGVKEEPAGSGMRAVLEAAAKQARVEDPASADAGEDELKEIPARWRPYRVVR